MSLSLPLDLGTTFNPSISFFLWMMPGDFVDLNPGGSCRLNTHPSWERGIWLWRSREAPSSGLRIIFLFPWILPVPSPAQIPLPLLPAPGQGKGWVFVARAEGRDGYLTFRAFPGPGKGTSPFPALGTRDIPAAPRSAAASIPRAIFSELMKKEDHGGSGRTEPGRI